MFLSKLDDSSTFLFYVVFIEIFQLLDFEVSVDFLWKN